MNSKYVSTAKPNTEGAVFRAPIGTTLPTTANEDLDNAFEELGYVSEDGVTKEMSSESEDSKAWGGDVVDSMQTSKTVNVKMKLIEVLNKNVLKAVYGSENVTGELETGLHIAVNTKETEESSWVIDMIERGGTLHRIVIPDVKLSEIGEINYKHSEDYGYDLTLKALVNEAGNYCDEYYLAADTESSVESGE